MATYYCVALSGEVSWTATSTWSISDGGASGSGPPTTGDTVIINRGRAHIGGSDQSAVSLAQLVVTFDGSIGSAGNPLKIGLAAPSGTELSCNFSGNHGDIYLAPAHAGSSNLSMFAGAGNVFLSGATAKGTFLFTGGTVAVNSSFDGAADNGWTCRSLGATVYIDSGATYKPTIVSEGGTVSSARPLGTTTAKGGGLVIATGTATASSITVDAFSQYRHQSSGTITLITVNNNGVASASGNPTAFTVTNSVVYGNGVLFKDVQVPPVYTNQPTQYAGGGLYTE